MADVSLSEYQEAFAYFDADRDGRITSAEFAQVLRAVGHAPTAAELAALTAITRSYGGCAWRGGVVGGGVAGRGGRTEWVRALLRASTPQPPTHHSHRTPTTQTSRSPTL